MNKKDLYSEIRNKSQIVRDELRSLKKLIDAVDRDNESESKFIALLKAKEIMAQIPGKAEKISELIHTKFNNKEKDSYEKEVGVSLKYRQLYGQIIR